MADPWRDAQSMAAERLTGYVDVWERSVRRLADGNYHSEDLVEDAFTLWGKWVRDSMAAAALTWRMAATTPWVGEGDER